MDPIISKLNQAAAEKILKGNLPPVSVEETSGFQKTFDKTLADRMLDKMKEGSGVGQQNMTVLSAENIQITTHNPEMSGKQESGVSGEFFDVFKDMNRSLLSMDSTLETLTTPGVKVSPQELLAMQAGVGSTTVMVEMVSRGIDSGARGIQSLVQMQV